jgi:hypothetical protein
MLDDRVSQGEALQVNGARSDAMLHLNLGLQSPLTVHASDLSIGP